MMEFRCGRILRADDSEFERIRQGVVFSTPFF
jgi:hypothetical protein